MDSAVSPLHSLSWLLRYKSLLVSLYRRLETQAQCVQTHLLEFILEKTIDETVSCDGGLADEFWRGEDYCEVCSFHVDIQLGPLSSIAREDGLTGLAIPAALCPHSRVVCMLGGAEESSSLVSSSTCQTKARVFDQLTHSES
jgi:hypothetical protein